MIVGKLYCLLLEYWEFILAFCLPSQLISQKKNQYRRNAHQNDPFVLNYLQTELMWNTENMRFTCTEASTIDVLPRYS